MNNYFWSLESDSLGIIVHGKAHLSKNWTKEKQDSYNAWYYQTHKYKWADNHDFDSFMSKHGGENTKNFKWIGDSDFGIAEAKDGSRVLIRGSSGNIVASGKELEGRDTKELSQWISDREKETKTYLKDNGIDENSKEGRDYLNDASDKASTIIKDKNKPVETATVESSKKTNSSSSKKKSSSSSKKTNSSSSKKKSSSSSKKTNSSSSKKKSSSSSKKSSNSRKSAKSSGSARKRSGSSSSGVKALEKATAVERFVSKIQNMKGINPAVFNGTLTDKQTKELKSLISSSNIPNLTTSDLDDVLKELQKNGTVKHADESSEIYYGIPEEKKFPLDSRAHVVSAVRFFNYAEPQYREELAKRLISKIKEYNIELSPTLTNKFYNYYKPEE